jgi:hypothetical protein
MPIIGQQNFYVRLRQTVNGQSCWANLIYAPLVAGVTASAYAFAEAWADSFVTQIRACMSEQARVESVNVSRRGPGGFNQAQINIGAVGSVADESLPAWDTASFLKYPSNLAIEGATPTPFEMGRFCLSGVPESFQSAGYAEPFAVAIMDGLADVIDTVTIGANDFQMHMARIVDFDSPPSAAAFVLNCAFNRIGTQLTRK